MVMVCRGRRLQTEREKLVEQQLHAEPQRGFSRITRRVPSSKLGLVAWKQQLCAVLHQQVHQTPPHLDGAVQRGLVQLLELRPDVLQVQLRPSHHDSGQSRLVGSAALTTTRARLYFAVDAETSYSHSPSCFYAGLLQSRRGRCSHT